MNLQILIVEDDKDISRNLKKLLESEGYLVSCAGNGQEAMDLLTVTPDLPCVIILDLMMPVMDGFQFREAQEKDSRIASIPVILMTADGHIDEKKLKARATAALRKPADVDTILDTIKAVC